MIEIILIIVSTLLVISGIMNIIQLRRQERLEDYVQELEDSNTNLYDFFKTLKTRMSESNSKIRSIDRLGAFKSDDETGFIFKEIQDIVEALNRNFE